MLADKVIAVIIPCYNVSAHIVDVLRDVPAFADHIIAVNDASPDKTAEILHSYQDHRLTVVHLSQNAGVGGAMVAGFRKALDLGADVLVKMDGDGQMKGEYMHCLVQPIVNDITDYAKGNRFLHSQELKQMPAARLAGNIILTFLTKIASGYWHIFDPQNGYLAVHSEFISHIDLERLSTRRYFFENEMLIQLNIEQARALDVAMPSVYAGEVSSLRISCVLTYFPRYLIRGFFYRLFQKYVLRDFSMIMPLYCIGLLLFIWGLLFGSWKWWISATTGVPATTGTIMIAMLPLILGFQMLLQGLLIEVMQSPRAVRTSHCRQPAKR